MEKTRSAKHLDGRSYTETENKTYLSLFDAYHNEKKRTDF